MHQRVLTATRGPTLILLVMVLAIVAIVAIVATLVAIPLSPTWIAVMGTLFLALVIGLCATALGWVIRHGIVSMTLLKNALAIVTGMYRHDTTLFTDGGDIRRLLRSTITSRRGMTPFYLTY